MTTIAYRDGVMASDSRAYAGDTLPLGAKVKIRRLGDGTLIGVSTPVPGAGEALIEWFSRGADRSAVPQIRDNKFTVLAVRPDGTGLYAYENFSFSGPLEAPFFAIGSGERFALGAMHMGADARRAVEVAIACDIWSGGPVASVAHDG